MYVFILLILDFSVIEKTTFHNCYCVLHCFIGKDGSEACKQAGIPFLCQLAYTLCDNNTMFQPSKERCYYVTTVACAKELVGFTDLLPDCEKFMEQTHPESKKKLK